MQSNPRKLSYGVHFGASETHQELPGFSVSLLTPTLRAEDVPLHTHEGASFVCVISGAYRSGAHGVGTELCEPMLIFNPAGTTHRDSFLLPHGRFLAVSISDEVLQIANAGAVLAGAAIAFSTGEGLRTALRLTNHCIASPIEGSSAMEDLCWELLSHVSGNGLWPDRTRAANPAWTVRAKELLNDTSSSSQGIGQIAIELGLHPVYFARAFRETFRCTPAEYRMRCRLGKAMGLLHNRKLALSEVGLRAGFFDQSHFTRAFRDHFGIPPHTYRKQL